MATTKEQAAEMQANVNRLARSADKTMGQVSRDIHNQSRRYAERLSQLTLNERKPKTATSIDAKAERASGAATGQPQAKKSKYRNKRVVIDGIKFASILEGHRYRQLKLLKAAGEIKDFEMQVTYRLDVNGVHICDYRADFVVKYPDGRTDVEDTKGVETPDFKLKKKLMLAIYGIEIVLIRSKK